MADQHHHRTFTRRDFVRITGVGGVGLYALGQAGTDLFGGARVGAATQGPGLSDPWLQPKFVSAVPDALNPGFIYDTSKGSIKVGVGQTVQHTGLVAPDGVTAVPTTVWGYGEQGL